MSETKPEAQPKKTIEQRRKEVWESGMMQPAIESWAHKKGNMLDMSIPANVDIIFKEFYGKEIMDESPAPAVCGWCGKTKGNSDTDCQCGRPTKYNEEIVRKTKKYLESCTDDEEEFHKTRGDKSDGYERILKVKLPSIEGLAVYLEVPRQRIYDWEKEYPVFHDIIDKLRSMQAERLINKGTSGEYNATITKVILTKHGYREGIENTGLDGKDLFSIDPEKKAKSDAAIDKFLAKPKDGPDTQKQ